MSVPETVELHLVETRETRGPLVYLDCPICGSHIKEGFGRGMAQMYLHVRKGQADCRLVVDVDPITDPHRVYEVPGDISMDEVLRAVMLDHDRTDRIGEGLLFIARQRRLNARGDK